jgi:hypothetical protein
MTGPWLKSGAAVVLGPDLPVDNLCSHLLGALFVDRLRDGKRTVSAAGRRGFVFARACFPCTDFFLSIGIV